VLISRSVKGTQNNLKFNLVIVPSGDRAIEIQDLIAARKLYVQGARGFSIAKSPDCPITNSL
jgi:hypothetical protein